MSARPSRSASWPLVLVLVLVAGAPAAPAAKPAAKPIVAELTQEHRHVEGEFSFRTPEDWTVAPVAGRPGVLDAVSGPLRVRFIWQKGGQGFDAAHVMCTLERLAPNMEARPEMEYEYEFISGEAAGRRFLDSAFLIHYDQPVLGAKDWRQRAFTIVSDVDALCVVTLAPRGAWRKSATKAVLDGILGSVNFDK